MKSPKSAMREKNVMGFTLHQLVYIALFLAVVAVVLGSLGTKAYYDVNDNPHDDQEMSDLRVNDTFSLSGMKFSAISTTTASITATAAANTDTLLGKQPANTAIYDLILIPNGNIVTAANAGDDLDLSLGTSSGGAQIIAARALLDDNGAAVTATANIPLAVIKDGQPIGANAFVTPLSNPATNEAMTLAAVGILSTTSERNLYLRFQPQATALTSTSSFDVFVRFIHF